MWSLKKELFMIKKNSIDRCRYKQNKYFNIFLDMQNIINFMRSMTYAAYEVLYCSFPAMTYAACPDICPNFN